MKSEERKTKNERRNESQWMNEEQRKSNHKKGEWWKVANKTSSRKIKENTDFVEYDQPLQKKK